MDTNMGMCACVCPTSRDSLDTTGSKTPYRHRPATSNVFALPDSDGGQIALRGSTPPPQNMQLAVLPQDSTVLSQVAGSIVPRLEDLASVRCAQGVGARTACEWQRELRQVCIEADVSEIDITSHPRYDWKTVLRVAKPGFAEQIIGDGIVSVLFRILGEKDANYTEKDGCGRHVFEFLRVDRSMWRLHYRKEATPIRQNIWVQRQ